MSDPVKLARKIPLEGCIIAHEGLTIRPVPDMGRIMVQRSNSVTDSEMKTLGQKFAERFGTSIPIKVCDKAVSNDGTITLLCLNPTSWIILCDDTDVASLTEWLEAAAHDSTLTISEITDQYICLDIEGRHARALLAKGCTLDLSNEAFPENHVARTLLAQNNIVIWRCGEGGYRIIFDVSLKNYQWHWLEGAAAEFAGNKVYTEENNSP